MIFRKTFAHAINSVGKVICSLQYTFGYMHAKEFGTHIKNKDCNHLCIKGME